ncbi:MAG: Efflux ABC transporter, permease protein [uncultured Acidimicrobiales bacterium]|uniref:Transport permease protein n=1 Tax=uncultured Acidimicrobiales bacterium TaxID=310071 RepID=A0A6J4IN06_9ACTN|nr:MAG: Efflux ABC transporter, permease protein [uncultured Acidimicrobiales bacterium]
MGAAISLTTPPAPTEALDRLRWALRDGLLVAHRDLTHWVREPQLIAWGLLFPVMFVLLFAYVLGSGIVVPGGGSYREFLMPGMFAQTMAFGIGETIASVQADSARGVTDRFRSMPLAPSAVVVGRSLANLVYSALSLVLMIGCGLAIGWRWRSSLGDALAAVGILLLLRFAFLWIGIILGLKATSAEMANSIFALLYPVTMLSNAFVAPELMPGWLGTVAAWNPLSSTITATRQLFGNPGVEASGWLAENAVLMAVVWPLAITVVSLPLAVRAYQRLSR